MTSKVSENLMPNTIQPLNLKGHNISLNWKKWLLQFIIYLRANNLENEKNSRKVALLLHHMGSDAIEVFSSFGVGLDRVRFQDLILLFDDVFTAKKNLSFERNSFFTRKQKQHETMNDFATTLKNLSLTCEFKDLREELVRDIFIAGLTDSNKYIKERLLLEGNITIDQCLDIARSMEITKVAQELQTDPYSGLVVEYMSNKRIDATSKSICRSSPIGFNKQDQSYNSNQKKEENNVASTSKCSRCGHIQEYKCLAQGTRIVYERSTLMFLRNSPLSQTPPNIMPDCPNYVFKGVEKEKKPNSKPNRVNGITRSPSKKTNEDDANELFPIDI